MLLKVKAAAVLPQGLTQLSMRHGEFELILACDLVEGANTLEYK